jgi:protein-arginine kinase activator protein McsA
MTTMRTDLQCMSCRKHKANLRVRKSKLRPNINLMLCNSCFESNFEPRAFVVIVARDRKNKGLERARDHIRNHLYVGDKITVEEIV